MSYRSRIEDLNYYSDPRVTARQLNGFDRFDSESMRLYVTLYDDDEQEYEADFPAKYEVCSTCDGQGKHVNPSIDCGGLTARDFDEDPDFYDDYTQGVFDVICYECKGKRVSPVVDEDCLTEEQKKNLKIFDELEEDRAAFAAEQAAERRMGA